MKKNIILIAITLALLIGLSIVFKDAGKTEEPVATDLGSITDAGLYSATTTAPAVNGTELISNVASPIVLKTRAGVLGSVIVTDAGDAGGLFEFYDATTTDITLRTNNTSTSSILITSLPTDLVAGTYVFDIATKQGLMVAWTGTIATTTITYR